ncbi:MAG: transcription antitermination factor NusB, partial [Polyangiales bacterium]
MVAPAREVAVRVLQRVEQDAAWATPTLDAEVRRASLGRADSALATQIVYGTLRVLPNLDAAIQRHAKRPVTVDAWTHAALVSAVFQLQHLGRVPSHAVVDDAVALVRVKRGKRLAGFANAILRKLAAARPDEPKPPTSVVVPKWLDRELRASIGDESTETLLRIEGDATTTDLRIVRGVDAEQVRASIAEDRPQVTLEPTLLSPVGLRVRGAGDPRSLRMHIEGAVAVQEEG